MAAKNFKKSPFDNFNIETEVKSKNDKSNKDNNIDTITNNEPKKVGRPKTKQGEYKTINISVPVEFLEKLKEVKEVYQGNLTLYINKLIEKDLEENYDKYLELVNSLKLFK